MNNLDYEKTECTRCGGSGEYSYNQIDGKRCFKCMGSGKQLTNRGKAAKKFANSILEVPIQDVPEQARFIYVESGPYSKQKHSDCVAHKTDRTVIVNGHELSMFEVFSRTGKIISSVSQGTKVRLHPNPKQIHAIAEHQASLTKSGKPRKSK